MTATTPPRVVIAGGGVAGLETLIALRDLAGDRVEITLVAPDSFFAYRPMTVAEPFAKGHARSYSLVDICARFGAHLIADVVAEVDSVDQAVRTRRGDRIPYDHLVLATGARATARRRRSTACSATPKTAMSSGSPSSSRTEPRGRCRSTSSR